MRKNTAFINLSDFTAFITPSSRKARKLENNKRKPFIVVNTDCDYGLFVKTLVANAKALGLIQQESLFRQKDIRYIRTNEFIVFGDSSNFCDFDYRVETDKNTLANLDNRSWKVYDLTSGFDQVLRRLEEYAKYNNRPSLRQPVISSEIEIEITSIPRKSVRPVIACPFVGLSLPRSTGGIKKVDYNRLKDFVNFAPVGNPRIQDIAIHYNWVKIGYDQYDINLDTFGREYIILESGATLYIREDRFGRKYLAQ